MTRRRVRFVLWYISLALSGCGSTTSVPPGPSPVASDRPENESRGAAELELDDHPAVNSFPSSSPADASLDSEDNGTQEAGIGTAMTQASFREPDLRPQHDAAKLADQGISVYESQRLRLYTDIEAANAQTLPSLVDAVFDQWQDYFGPLPPARDGSDFQLSAYVMRDQQLFRSAGLLPVNLPVFSHGKHQGQEFWINEQEHTYYLRHLLLHEATHCYMQAMGGTTIDVPLWYLEGMAELFATHSLDESGRPTFRVLPPSSDEFVGFGRIEMIRRDIDEGNALTMSELADLTSRRFRRRQSAYAWSWSICLLADRHPEYRDAFQKLGRRYPAEGFEAAFGTIFGPIAGDFEAEWTLMNREFCYGFDIERAAIQLQRGQRLSDQTAEHESTIAAGRGWQASGVEVVENRSYDVTTTGRVTLADDPKPWVSEPDGVTIRYAEGHPIGRLLGVIVSEPDERASGRRDLSPVIPLGAEVSFTAPMTGALYLRVNDFWNELADNRGEYSVTITR